MVPKLRTPATVLLGALLILVGFAGNAVASHLITGKDIKNGSITGKDIKNGSITTKDVKNGTLTGRTSRRAAWPETA